MRISFYHGELVADTGVATSFYGGNLIFRGHFNASGEETAMNLVIQGGFAFGYSAWLNAVFLGSSQGSPTVSMTTDTWTIPNGTLRVGSDNVLVVLQGDLKHCPSVQFMLIATFRSYGVRFDHFNMCRNYCMNECHSSIVETSSEFF